MKKFLQIICLMMVISGYSISSGAYTNVAGGYVYTTWTTAGSPYYILGDIVVPEGKTHIIEPGVVVEFKGYYGLYVEGRLIAKGNSTNLITFIPTNTKLGWKGIRYPYNYYKNDTSFISYCKILHGVATSAIRPDDQCGGGIFVKDFSKLVISNCLISNCYADLNGGGIYCGGSASPVIINNIICNNTAISSGGGIALNGKMTPILHNNTIVNNYSNTYSGGLDVQTAEASIKNCIFWGNRAGTKYNQIGGNVTPRVDYSDVEGGYSGKNIDSDPLFNHPSTAYGFKIIGYTADWGLKSGSPCINKGTNSVSNYLPLYDYKGNLRIDYDVIDMGALEYIQSDVLCGAITSNRTLSKYVIITCDVTVNNGVTLTIPAGAKVRFTGAYKLNVLGRLLAQGSYSQLIRFYPVSSSSPWKGIRFESTPATNDTSKIEYCLIQYSYATGTGNDVYGGAVFSNSVSKLIIRNNYITNNRAASNGGAMACFNGSPFIIGNLIANNTSSAVGGGIYISNCNSYIINNTITRNSATTTNGTGFYSGSGAPKLRNNIIWENNSSTSPYQVYPTTLADVQYCDIQGAVYTGTGNINVNPLFVSTTAGSGYTYDAYIKNWTLQTTSTIIGTGMPTATMSSQGLIAYLPSLDLKGKSRLNGTIEPGAFEDFSSISVCGIISQNTTWNAATVHITCNVTVKNGVTLTIAPGTRVVFDNMYYLRVKGTLIAQGTATDSIKFLANVPSTGWGGIRFDSNLYYSASTMDTSKFEFCRFEFAKNNTSHTYYNTYGGALFVFYFHKLKIENSVFTNNSNTYGGALATYRANFTIRNCNFYNNSSNYGGAVYVSYHYDSYEPLLIENCIISNNTSAFSGGGMYFSYSPAKVINTIIANNYCSYTSSSYGGGGIGIRYDCFPNFINCTIVNNSGYHGGGIHCYNNSDPIFKNCIVYGNTASTAGTQFYLYDVVSDPKIYYSDIQGGTSSFAGTGSGTNYANIYQNNIDANPTFVAPTAGSGTSYNGLAANWRLNQGSPCINVATPGIQDEFPEFDLDGKPRIYNGRMDMGAFENQQDILACGTISSDKVWEADIIKITCNISISNGATLTIKPGTYVQFEGPYSIDVQGRLLASGTPGKRITFTINDTTNFSNTAAAYLTSGGWQGIRFNSPSVSNDSSKLEFCNFTYGKALSGFTSGGALYIYNTNKLLVSNCYFSKNIALNYGSAIFIESSNPRILNNVICNNNLHNLGYYGIVYMDDASPDFYNNTIVNNIVRYYGALFLTSSSSPNISNCIFYNNTSNYYGTSYSDIFVNGANCQPIISNCIFTSSSSTYLYSVKNKQNLKYGNPVFVSPLTGRGAYYNGLDGDWSLQSTTPCLNSGSTSSGYFHLPGEDIAGFPRLVGDTIDLGAFEIQIHNRFITSHPTAVTACVGSQANFSVSASIPVSYQWQKGGTDISGATNKSLTISAVALSDSGYYRCIMSNQYGNVISDSAKLTVRTSPTITSHPSPTTQSACLGATVNYTITATGSAPLTYQWYNLNGNLSGGSNATYSINPVVTGSASTYYCLVTNNCGAAASNGATLSLNTPVSVTPITSSTSVCVGGTASWTTVASGTTPFTYKWYKNASSLISGATSAQYQITNAQTSNAGNYYCKVSNVCNADSTNTATLTVNTVPSITYTPPDDSVCVGQSKSFITSASSSLAITYQWYYPNNTTSISGATSNIYTINSVAANNGGNYYCKATNNCGTTEVGPIKFTVKTSPSISSQSASLSLCVGTQANFSVTVTGTAPITYKWYKDNTQITGATTSSYTISSVSTSDAANYYCVITNSCGSINSSVKTLTVNTPASISWQSTSDSVCAGQSKAFSVTASGTSPISYQWYYNSTTNTISGATNYSYTINSVSASHGGTYYCKAWNTCNTSNPAITSTITLTVKSAPSITSQSTSTTLCTGQQANFSVTATGTSPLTYKWYKDNTLISSATGATHTITSSTTSDAGNYYCVISNSCGYVNSSVKTLTVNTSPAITSQSASDSVCSGQSKAFSITASGSPAPTYQWYKNTTTNAISGATNNSYTISSVGSTHGGTYYCKASNTCGDATTSAITLTVKSAPAITTQSSSLNLCVGQQASFSVTVTGTSPITYKWYKDNTAINGAVGSSYTINSVTTNDAGNYYCSITNSCGTISSSTKTLTVNTAPSITSQSASDSVCAGQTKIFSIGANGSSPLTYQWYYNTTSNAISGATNNFYTISSVKTSNGGLYYCKVTNSCGSATTSQISLTVRTAPVITAQSTGATRCEGQSQYFSVTATGSPTPKYQWYKDDVPISGATNNIYTISVLSASDAGNYYCIVSNACDDVKSNTKTLTVNTPPEITAQSGNIIRCSGQSMTIDVTCTGTTPISYQWYHMGYQINGAVNNYHMDYSINPNDSGTYYCVATNNCGSDQSANIHLAVNIPVSVYKQSRDTSRCEGDATLFFVQVKGTEPINYAWYFENDSIAGAHKNSYYLTDLTQAHSGIYYCQMTNVCGTVDGGEKELFVRALPDVKLGNDTTFCFGNTLEISADGPYYCKWNNGSTKSWVNVTHSGTFFVHVTDPYGCKNYSDTINVTVLEPFAGEILCVVTVDSSTGKNLLAWERSKGYRTASYNVYKETNQKGVYQRIGSLPFDSLSVLIDTSSNPRVKADRYALTVVDSCGNESDYSPFHKTIHLTANKGTSTENNLIWSHYEGFPFNTYRIYRGSTPSTMTVLNSIASNLSSYTDLTPLSGVNYYQVSAVKLDTCYPANTRAQTSSGPYSQSISNLKDYCQLATNYLSASPVEAYIGWEDGSTAYFTIYTNIPVWDAKTSATWFKLEKNIGNNILKAVAFWNDKRTPRSDTIQIMAEGVAAQEVVLYQVGMTGINENTPDINLLVYPNPFNYSTNIEYELLNEADVSIEVYNMIGTRVASIVNNYQQPGKYNFTFDDASTDGIYILRVNVNNTTFIKKLIKTE